MSISAELAEGRMSTWVLWSLAPGDCEWITTGLGEKSKVKLQHKVHGGLILMIIIIETVLV
jgi:hypothetical protein